MRRLIVLVLMLLVPLQFAWSTVLSLHGHAGDDRPALGFHSHAGDHDHAAGGSLTPHDVPAVAGSSPVDSADGHHAGHYHPVFVSLIIDADVRLDESPPGAPPLGPTVTLTSRIPPLFDWPPAARG